ncbi:MAG: flavin monoamine oxidase family protein [Rubrivivax sp.]|jgi:monoamine oxidase
MTVRKAPTSPLRPSRRQLLRLGAVSALGVAWPALTLRAQPSGPDVLVLGAGLAGLSAALRLEERGARVQVIEAAHRVGGRIHTLDDLPGRPETGGTQIGTGYVRTMAMVQRLGLSLEPNARSPLFGDDKLVLFVAGRRYTLAEWARADANPMPEPLRAMPPDRALSRLVLQGLGGRNPLAGVEAWRDPVHSALDLPLSAWLREKLALSDAALALLDANVALGDTLAETSLLNQLYSQANLTELLKTPGPVQNVVGGNSRLPEAMAKALRGRLSSGYRAGSLLDEPQGIQVTAFRTRAPGGAVMKSIRFAVFAARACICTLPLPALRKVRVEPGLPAPLARAVASLPYARITQLHLEVRRRFWEADGSSPFLWSDGPLERIFPQDRAGNGQPPTLTVWVNGAGTASWDALGDPVAQDRIDDVLADIWPGARGATRLLHRTAWHREPESGGAWANWAPGQVTDFGAALAQPHGRIHFAGEHTGTGLRGIEAAIASGERAADAVLARL